jgi:L-alanine-DL-glutamate epimerase-like enolase superfamily enzyme
MKVEMATFPVRFRVVFRLGSAARAAADNVVVRITMPTGETGHGEGCPRMSVTGETAASARAFLAEHARTLVEAVDDLDDLENWIDEHRSVIDRNPAAFCALELAMLDVLARLRAQSVEALLDVPDLRGSFTYSAVLSDNGRFAYPAQLLRYLMGGFRHYKLELSGDLARDRSRLGWLRGRLGSRPAASVRVDANNRWSEPELAVDHLRRLDLPLIGVEEPLAVNDLDGFLAIAEALDTQVILDERVLRESRIEQLPGDRSRWILNCRVSKSGGLLRSLALIEGAIDAGLGVIVGAHVGETSLLTRAGLTAAAGAGSALIAQEGAFGTHLLSRDVCNDPLMFGRRGVLGDAERAHLGPHGLGIDVLPNRLTDVEAL